MVGQNQDNARWRMGRWRAAYPALITAAASFLLVVLLWPQSPRIYVAESVAAASGAALADAPAEEIERWLLSDEVLRATAENLRSKQPRHYRTLAGQALADPAAALRERVRPLRIASPDESPRLAVVCQAEQRRAALALADELAGQLVHHFPAYQQQAIQAANEEQERELVEELRAAEAAEERLRVRLDGLRDARLVSASPPPTLVREEKPAEPTTESSRAAELRRSLDGLLEKRDRLLEVFLPAHPQVRTLQAQIERLEERLRRIPVNSAPGQSTHVKRGRAVEVTSGQSPVNDDPKPNLADEIRRTQASLLEAIHHRQEAQAALQSAEQARQTGKDRLLVWSAAPARIIDVLGGPRPSVQLAVAVLAAAAGGMLVVWLSRKAESNCPLSTSADVCRSLSLPVLGTLASSGNDEPLPTLPVPLVGRCIDWLTRSSEVVLLTFAITVLLAVALDVGFARDLLDEPLAALGELLQVATNRLA